jgi:hypothetical protein
MRKLLLLLCLFASSFVFSQSENKDVLTHRTMASMVYHAPHHESPLFRVTIRTSAVNSKVLQTLTMQPEVFDGMQMAAIAKYNIRLRWRFGNNNRLYVGTETMSAGYGKNSYYIGFRKMF